MGKITDIQKQKRNSSRVSVFIDGEFVCGLDAVTAISSRIAIGDEITEAELKSLVERSETDSAFERAAGYLSSSPRSKREIEQYLSRKGYDASIVEAAVDRLLSYKYIDDSAYARCYIRSKASKCGKLKLVSELRKKGVSSSVIEQAFDEAGEESDADIDGQADCYAERDGAIAVARKYVKSHSSAVKFKLMRYLAGRGFTRDAIDSAVRELDDEGRFDSTSIDYTDE